MGCVEDWDRKLMYFKMRRANKRLDKEIRRRKETAQIVIAYHFRKARRYIKDLIYSYAQKKLVLKGMRWP